MPTETTWTPINRCLTVRWSEMTFSTVEPARTSHASLVLKLNEVDQGQIGSAEVARAIENQCLSPSLDHFSADHFRCVRVAVSPDAQVVGAWASHHR